ncbi:MAG: ATP synthase F1 subunit delta [Candidatus Pacebacteria bacterium]|jgi:F-type H+-transporting ATPase subunit delta|nr:ATP synthase F1 subunit delta [Candidatus Paceibacterota bacterium]
MANISYNEIARSIYEASLNKEVDQNTFAKNVISFLNRRKLFSKSKIILKHLDKILNEDKGLLEVRLITAYPLIEKDKKSIANELKKIYQKNSVIFEERIDMRLIGGFRLEIGEEIIDLSISNKLQKLQKYLTK